MGSGYGSNISAVESLNSFHISVLHAACSQRVYVFSAICSNNAPRLSTLFALILFQLTNAWRPLALLAREITQIR